jgi:flagellar biosynthetic protein FliR
VRSLVVGALLGFTVNLVFTAVRYAGSIVGMQIGFAIVNSFDPLSNSQVSVISQMYYLLAVLLFFTTGAHQILVAAMFQSCLAVPPFAPGDPVGGAWYLMREFSSVFILGLKIAAPVVIVLLLVSASMGVIVKTVPQLNVLVVGFPIKIGVGLITLGLSLVFFRQVTVTAMSGIQNKLAEMLLAMQ